MVRKVAHFAGVTGCYPIAIARHIFGRFGARYAGQFEPALARQSAHFITRQISSPTDRMSSSALLLRTTPGRIA